MTSIIKAITKEEVVEAVKNRDFPDFVIQAFNECIVESKIRRSSKVYQKDVVEKIRSLNKNIKDDDIIFENNWLDVEEFYKKSGWDVSFYRHGYNETGEDYFIFE